MTEARKLTGAERCSLFLLDREENVLVAKVFDGNSTENLNECPQDISIPVTEGIAGHVAMSGEILNINNAYEHPLFYRKIDDATGFKTRNILCFPIQDDNGIIGVAELCNKINGSHFTQFDEEIASTFSVYCAICIMHSLMWKKVRDAQSRSRLSNGLIMQSKVSEEEFLRLTSQMSGANCINEHFRNFTFIPRLLTDSEAAHKSVLAALYSSEGSVLEEYKQCLDYIRDIILATDLAHHFRILKDIKKVLTDGYDRTNQDHHNTLLCLIVTSCDLSDQTKDWSNTKEIAKLIYREFFSQGDLEKAMGVMPSEMMDREKARIPRLQINFLEQVVSPVFELLAGFFPDLQVLVDTINEHKRQWDKVEQVFTEHLPSSNISPLDFLDDERVDGAAMSA
ncbi:cGMP-dependent 3',5'-cyclic phosphodiesterase [Trichonephila clavipes]|nr:cGMP-dependent 3',5'-cyclic phosphodiesterase [Trichonephila clavipes]